MKSLEASKIFQAFKLFHGVANRVSSPSKSQKCLKILTRGDDRQGMNVAVRSTARMMIINGNGLKVNGIYEG